MPVTPNWVVTEDWEVLYLADVRMPGVATVNVSFPSGLDIQKPKGKKKARVRDIGTPPAELDIEIELLPEDMEDFDRIITMLSPRSLFGPREKLSIAHPNAALWGVGVITIGEIHSPQPKAGGTYVLKISAMESTPPTKIKKPAAKPKTDDPSGWDIPPLIDALRPGASGAPQQNFSSGDIPGSGF